MPTNNRIPIPLEHRWRRFRYGALPVVCFVGCAVLGMFLWRVQGQMPNAVGEVEAYRNTVTAATAGLLLKVKPPADREFDPAKLTDRLLTLEDWEQYGTDWSLGDTVNQSDVIARLDHRPIEANLGVIDLAVKRLGQELVATAEQLRLDAADRLVTQAGFKIDNYSTWLQLTTAKEQLSISILDRQSLIVKAGMVLNRFERHLQFIETAYKNKAISDVEYYLIKDQRDEAAAGLKADREVLVEAEAQYKLAEKRLATFEAQYPELPIADDIIMLAPLRTAIVEQEAQLEDLKRQIDALVIRAPSSGTICEVFKGPGDNVQAGEPILTIAATTGVRIVSYIRENQRIRPDKRNWEVEVKRFIPRAQPVLAAIENVGPQIEPIPAHLLQDPVRPEWGLPVWIRMPDSKVLPLLPGEKVNVRFKTKDAG